MNPVANSTKEMGPGLRRDTLDDHFGDINWRKVTGLAATLKRRSSEAVEERQKHVTVFIKFDASLPLDSMTKWTVMVKIWDLDQTQLNPFESTKRRIMIHEHMPPSLLLTQGLELEEQQRCLCIDAKALGSHSTDLQITKVIERANRLKRQIDAWSTIQLLYMPGILKLHIIDGSDTLMAAVNGKLYLPSEAIDHIPIPYDIMELELRLRFVQAHNALHDIRHLILVRTQMYTAKDRFARGQSQVTCAQNLALSVQGRIDTTAQKYQICRESLLHLAQPLKKVNWDLELRPLYNEDISGDFDPAGPRMQEALRIEWCKAHARAHCWQEECLLLQEEMRRVKEFLSWEEWKWIERTAKVEPRYDLFLAEGQKAYAFRQAAICVQLHAHCEVAWKGIPDKIGTGPGIPEGPDGQYYRIECH
ncbi:hypothetical protein BDZ94DRAFT_1312961 [Collybia nuda]|uniref:Uncharacterized protein n=1 Tax=Collybia nuda TaxID=64659 RepID=A0A9P5Y018_9AGAR|nr:hypothetical protein BDZ94DRAFT_1312961 [Collybia nuda]